MGIVIGRASATDAKAVLNYLKQIGGETDNLTFGAEGLPFTAEEEADHIRQMEHSRDDVLFVAKEGDRIVGDASLSRLPRRMQHRGDLGISVIREYWNQGVGSRLLEAVLQFAEENGFEIVELQVRSDNAPAIHLYEKFGFQKMGTHPDFFRIGDQRIPFDYMYRNIP